MTHIARANGNATWPLLQTVFESILEVFLLCFAGWFLARRSILDKKTQKKLNILNINLFTPALLFSKVAFFLSPSKLKELWVIPFIFVIVTLTSTISGWALSRAFRLKRSQRAFAIAASMFMNSNSLPIALMQSLVVTVHGLKWGKDDTRDGMLGRALTYLVLHSTFGMMLRWSYGVKLLSQADDDVPPEQSRPTSPASEHSPLLNSRHMDYSTTTLRSNRSIPYTDEQADISPDTNQLSFADTRNTMSSTSGIVAPTRYTPKTVTSAQKVVTLNDTDGNPQIVGLPPQLGSARPVRPPIVNRRSHFFYSFPNTPQLSRDTSREAIALPPAPPSPVTALKEPTFSTRAKTFLVMLPSRTWAKLKDIGSGIRGFMTPPLYSALLSLFVACIPPLQHMLDVHMLPVKGAIASAGNCSIPITLVVLGGYFWRETPSDGDAGDRIRTNLPQQNVPERERTQTQDRRVSDATLISTGTLRSTWNTLKSRSKGYMKTTDDGSDPHPRNGGAEANGLPFSPALEEARTRIPPPVPAKPTSTLHKGEGMTVLVAILSRMIITPAILLPVMALIMSKTTMRLFDDPVFVLSNVLFISSPPALTLAQITQAASGDAFERLISKTIFWSYCIVTPITTMIYCFVGLELSRL